MVRIMNAKAERLHRYNSPEIPRNKLNHILLNWVLLVFALIFNPFYILMFCVFCELFSKVWSGVFWVLTGSIILGISNREIGGAWGSLEAGFANDDALNYLSSYLDLATQSYVARPGDYAANLLSGSEPGWFLLMELTGNLTGFSQAAMMLVSVGLPILVIHYALLKILNRPFFGILVVYFLSPEILHMFYHLWRFSLAISLVILIFFLRPKNWSYMFRRFMYVLPLITHLVSALPLGILYLSESLKQGNLQLYGKFKLLLLLIAMGLVFGYLSFQILLLIEFTKIIHYLTNMSANQFSLNFRFLLQIGVAAYVCLVTKRNDIFMLCSFAIIILTAPLLLSLPEIFMRIAVIITPFVSICYCLEVERHKYIRLFTSIVLSALFIRLALFNFDTGHYQYMARGNFFSYDAGFVFNLLGVFGVG